MKYTVVYEKITEPDYPAGYYYAHIPALDLTTHGLGIEGAKNAAKDLVKVWLEEKQSSKEEPLPENEFLVSTIEV